MQPCAQEPTIERIESKVDRIVETLTSIAVQAEQIRTLRTDVDELYGRVRVIEDAPLKRLERAIWAVVGFVGAVVLAYVLKAVGV